MVLLYWFAALSILTALYIYYYTQHTYKIYNRIHINVNILLHDVFFFLFKMMFIHKPNESTMYIYKKS